MSSFSVRPAAETLSTILARTPKESRKVRTVVRRRELGQVARLGLQAAGHARAAATCFAAKSQPRLAALAHFLYRSIIKERTLREAEVGLRGKRGRSFVENTPREG